MDTFNFAVLTASDKASEGKRQDESGALLVRLLERIGGKLVEKKIVPDVREIIAICLRDITDKGGVDLLVTTGGTGFTARDITPEATGDVIERMVPGIPEAIRAEGMKHTRRAMLSRGIAGIRGKTLIINLPGSTKAVREGVEVISGVLSHALDTLGSEHGLQCGEVEEQTPRP